MAEVMTDISQLRRSPLAHLEDVLREGAVTGERGVTLREVPFLTQVGLRVEPGSAAAAALENAAGVALPAKVGETTGDTDGSGGNAVGWLGPGGEPLVSPGGSGAWGKTTPDLGSE